MKTAPSHKKLKNWDGYSRKGQAAYDAQFEFEKTMQDKVDHCTPNTDDPYDMYYGL